VSAWPHASACYLAACRCRSEHLHMPCAGLAWEIELPEPCAAFATLNLELSPFRQLQSGLKRCKSRLAGRCLPIRSPWGCCLADNPQHRVRSGALPRRTVLLTYGVCRHGRDATKGAPTSTVSASDSQSSRASGCACNLTGAAWRRGSTSAIGTQFHISVRWPYAAGTRWEDFREMSTMYGSQYLAAVAVRHSGNAYLSFSG